MASSSPTMIVALYRLRPERKGQWLETWRHLATIAASTSECHTFDLELDPDNPDQCRIVSTWSSGSAFDRFVRDVGLTWIERDLNYSRVPPRYARFEFPPFEPAEPMAGKRTHAYV